MMNFLDQDVFYAARQLRKNPGFTDRGRTYAGTRHRCKSHRLPHPLRGVTPTLAFSPTAAVGAHQPLLSSTS